MANIKSAIKRARVADQKNLRNRMKRSSMRTQVKRFETALAEGNVELANSLYSQTVSAVDKAASRGVIHKSAANRKKSRMALSLAKAQ